MSVRSSVFVLVALLLTAAIASAEPMLMVANSDKSYQNIDNVPCIFGEKSACVHSSTDYIEGTGNGNVAQYDLRQTYTVEYLLSRGVNEEFFLALDVNEGGPTQKIQALEMTIGNVVYRLGSPLPREMRPINNGVGFADYVIGSGGTSLTDLQPFSLAGLTGETVVTFHFSVDPANDGAERLFFSNAESLSPVPEPGSMVLLGTTLLACGTLIRRHYLGRK